MIRDRGWVGLRARRCRMACVVQFALAAASLPQAGAAESPAAPVAVPPGIWQVAIQAFVTADRKQPPPPNPVLFVGSSSFAFWHTLAADMKPLVALNRGFGGSSTADVLTYYDFVIKPYNPRALVIYEGGNDVAGGVSPEAVIVQMERLIGRVQQDFPGVPILFITVRPSRARWHLHIDERRVNRLMLEMAERHPGVGFIDGNRGLLDARGEPDLKALAPDQLHLGAEGNQRWCGVLKQAIEQALAGKLPRPSGLARLLVTTSFDRPVWRGEQNVLDLSVANTGPEPLVWQGRWREVGPGVRVQPERLEALDVPAGESRMARFTLQVDALAETLPFCEWTATAGGATIRGQAAVLARAGGHFGRNPEEAARHPLVCARPDQAKSFGGAWGGLRDCSASAWVARTPDGLRVQVAVTDDVLCGGASEPWNNDAVELHFDFRPAGKRIKERRTDGCIQVIAVPALAPEMPGQVVCFGPAKPLSVPGIRLESARCEGGYTVEVFVPWDGLRAVGATPTDGELIFTYAVDDADVSGVLKQQVRWGGQDADHQRPGLWGRLLPAEDTAEAGGEDGH